MLLFVEFSLIFFKILNITHFIIILEFIDYKKYKKNSFIKKKTFFEIQ